MTKLFLASYYDANRVTYRVFDTQENQEKDSKIISLHELPERELHGYFLPYEVASENYALNNKDLLKNLNIVTLPENDLFNLDQCNLAEAIQKYLKYISPLLLRENLNTLSQLFPTLTHLKSLFPNERTTFFEEVWYLINRNIGASNLKIIFNDLDSSHSDEQQKKKLIQVIIEGNHQPNPVENSDLGSQLMKLYESKFDSHFDVAEWDTEEGRLVILAKIHNSPCIVMAETIEFSFFQKSLLKAFFDGLNEKI